MDMFDEMSLLSKLHFFAIELEFYPRREMVAKMVFIVTETDKSIYTASGLNFEKRYWHWNIKDNTWNGERDLPGGKLVTDKREKVLAAATAPFHENIWQGLLAWKNSLPDEVLKEVRGSADNPGVVSFRYSSSNNDIYINSVKDLKLAAWWIFSNSHAASQMVQTVNLHKKTINPPYWKSGLASVQYKREVELATRKILANLVRTIPTLSVKIPQIEWGPLTVEPEPLEGKVPKLTEIYRINWEEEVTP